MCNTSTLIKSKKLGQILQEIQHAICNLHKVLNPKITCSMITVPEFKGHLRPVSYSLFCVPTFFCIKGVCITSCPPQSFRQIFLVEKLKWNQMKHLLFSLKGRLQFSFWYRVLRISITQDVVSIEISSYISIYKPSNYSLLDISCNPLKSF